MSHNSHGSYGSINSSDESHIPSTHGPNRSASDSFRRNKDLSHAAQLQAESSLPYHHLESHLYNQQQQQQQIYREDESSSDVGSEGFYAVGTEYIARPNSYDPAQYFSFTQFPVLTRWRLFALLTTLHLLCGTQLATGVFLAFVLVPIHNAFAPSLVLLSLLPVARLLAHASVLPVMLRAVAKDDVVVEPRGKGAAGLNRGAARRFDSIASLHHWIIG